MRKSTINQSKSQFYILVQPIIKTLIKEQPLLRLFFMGAMSMLIFSTHLTAQTDSRDCVVCDRISLFQKVKHRVAEEYWPSFITKGFTPPMVYLDDSFCWLSFSQKMLFPDLPYRVLTCGPELTLYRINTRIDSIPFHMENKINFKDTASPYYFNPVMFCSGLESTSKLVPDVVHTEEWLQMVMHEYFHAFQFNQPSCIRYLADSVIISADSLDNIYMSHTWFKDYLIEENDYLLAAIHHTSDDSTRFFLRKFLDTRKKRRQEFLDLFHYDITQMEKFWEKIEGSARYIEYYTAYVYVGIRQDKKGMQCDSLFNHFRNYQNPDFLKDPWFYKKTEVMAAYYYATGFNLCRLLDRLKVDYKNKLFMHPSKGLEDYL